MPFTECPLCSERYPEAFIAIHASSCNPSAKHPQTQLAARNDIHVYRIAPPKSGPLSETGAPGFHSFPNVFSDIETELLHNIHVAPPQWTDYRFRKVKNYGPPYNLRERRFLFGSSVPPQIPIPQFVHDIVLPRMRNLPMLSDFSPNQLSVAEYSVPGGHILPHNDCENDNIRTAVVGVCLAARCTMTLILRARYTGLGKEVKKDVVLLPGTVYIMSGDALRLWEHAIFPRNIDATRYSLTFRDVSPPAARSFGAKVKRVSRQTYEGKDSAKSRTEARPHHLSDHVSTVNAEGKAIAQFGVKRRRFVQQRLT